METPSRTGGGQVRVSSPRRALDLDHLGAEVGEQHGGVGAGEDPGEVGDQQAGQRARPAWTGRCAASGTGSADSRPSCECLRVLNRLSSGCQARRRRLTARSRAQDKWPQAKPDRSADVVRPVDDVEEETMTQPATCPRAGRPWCCAAAPC